MRRYSVTPPDSSLMRKLLIEFPRQVEDAVRIGASVAVRAPATPPRAILVTGLGGSAIGGDLLRTYLAGEMGIPFFVNRHYFLPAFVDRTTLVIVSSYSGNTEETIAAHRDAVRRKARIVCISSDGTTSALAARHRQPLIAIPRGYPPRAALGYSFFAPLMLLAKMRLIRSREGDILETLEVLKEKSSRYSSEGSRNSALQIARRLHGSLPVIYSSADRFDVVNLRWRGQIEENAKMLAFGNVLPEMNHNEIVGWNVPRQLMREMAVVFLRDREDHRRVDVRMNITRGIVREYARDVIDVRSEGSSLLARMFSLIYLGDWVSYYLAMLNRVDPTPVKVIDLLKKKLEKV